VAAEAEAQTGASFVGGKADGGEDVRWLDGARGASGSCGTSETFQVKRNEEGFAFDAGKDNVRSVRSTGSGGAVHTRLRDTLHETLLKFVAESGDAPSVFRERFPSDFGGFAESHDASDIFCAGTEAALVMSAIEKLAQTRSAADV
jgi:hypothetical protein